MAFHYDLSDLRLVRALMRTRSLSAAAAEICLTVSGASLRLKKLEDSLGAVLFSRVSKGLVPTAAGIRLAEEARNLLAQASHLDSVMRSFSNASESPLRIYSVSAGLQNYLIPIMAQLLRVAPDFRCVFREERSRNIPEDVFAGEADLGMVGGIETLETRYRTKLELIPYATDRHVLIVPENSSLVGRASVSFGEALGLRYAALLDLSPMTISLRERAAAAGGSFDPVIQVPSFAMILELVRGGGLAAVVPESALRNRTGFCVIRLEDAWAARPLSFVLPAQREPSPMAREFVDFALSLRERQVISSASGSPAP